jgi:leader peptidase (prepilin peptidase)/N-methyltransferase
MQPPGDADTVIEENDAANVLAPARVGYLRNVTGVVTAICGVFGLAVGSFLNVVIHRVPRKESIVRPRSRCPTCGTQLAERDNIPVISWLLLGGKCRTCRTSISPRYPAVELLTAGLFAAVGARFGADWALPAFLVFAAGMISLAFIDLEHYLLPKRIVYSVLLTEVALLIVAAAGSGRWHRLLIGAISGAASFAVFFTLNFINPRWLAFGDVRLSAPIGLTLGWLGAGYVPLGFLAANLLGAVVGLGLIAAKRIERKTPIPFGVFLALGAFVAIFAGAPILHWYRRP